MAIYIRKRDGRVVPYDYNKTAVSIVESAKTAHGNSPEVELAYIKKSHGYSKEVEKIIDEKFGEDIPSTQDVQDVVEKVLNDNNESQVSKSYIAYRNIRTKARGESTEKLNDRTINYKNLIDSYINVEDWRVKENSTVTYSVGGLILSNSGAVTANYWLNEIYDEEIANAHKSAAIHIHDLSMLTGYCFTGDTVVKTLDGRNPTFKELVDNKEDDIWVYSYDIEHGEVVPAKARNPRVTRKVSELVELVFCNGDTVRCTSDHPFLMRDGTYRKASDLRTNDSIMPLYVSENSEYSVINKAWSNQKSKTYLHRWIAEKYYGRQLERDEVVHHKNGNKHDNRPENIEIIKDSEHRALEIRKTMDTELWKSSNGKRMADYNRSEEKRKQIRDFASTRDRNSNGQFIKFAYNQQNDVAGLEYNHRIRKKRVITLDSPIDVYDLTVPNYSNFAIGAGVFVHNCAGWSLKQLIKEGLGGVNGKITSTPASHLSTLCNQMVNFLGIMQNEWAGAQAFSSFDTYLAPFIRVDNLTQKEVKQCIQSFVYGVNTPSRWGTQAPFTNITLDWVCPNDLKNLNAIVGGKEQDFTYGECQKEMDMVNKAFIEVMIEGDANGRGFQYPIPTYSITSDFDWSDTENNKLLFEMTAKYGTPYFSNYINSDMSPSDVRSMCCRLRLDLRELRKKSGGFFGSGESTGSVGVVTINMPRIAYESENEEDFYARLDKMMDISARSLHIKRKAITKFMEDGLYPYTKRYLGTFSNHFSTIGLLGMNEAGLNAKWLKADLTHEKVQKFTKDVLNHMRDRLSDYQEMYEGELYNLEATPAESTSYRLAKHDKKRYPDIITANENGTPYYTNSSHLPVGYTEDIFTALDVQDELQTLYTSGTVFHAFLGEKLPTWQSAASLVRKIAENYKLPYYTMSPTYSVCKEHGYISGEQYVCPKCGQKTEVYSRITGYYRPVQNWNDGKSQEFKDRRVYKLNYEEPENKDKKIDNEDVEDFCEACSIDFSEFETDLTPMLFVSPTCPNCKLAANMMDNKGFTYKKVVATENIDMTKQYDIKQAPTLVVLNSDGSYNKYKGVSDIKGYLNNI